MRIKIYKIKILFALMAGLCLMLQSCNEKDDEKNPLSTQNVASVAVKSFSLKKHGTTANALDSIYFAIDLKNGVIFNSDSLPKGTDISALSVNMEFDQNVSEILVTMSGGSHREGTTSLRENPSDTIDFTGKVTIDVTSQNGNFTFQYLVKVNVHQQEPDTMEWGDVERTQLPSQTANPRDQKTVRFKDKIVSLIEEENGSITLAESDTVNITNWQKQTVAFSFSPQVRTFTAGISELYILDSSNELYSSADGKSWNSTGEKWISIIGSYGNQLLGIKESSGQLVHTIYPSASNFKETALESDFPISGFTNFVSFNNKWIVEPIGLLSGGVDGSGNISGDTWAYDGSNWAKISDAGLPGLKDATMVRYEAYKKVPNQSRYDQFKVWLVMGGVKNDGSLNRNVYFSFDNGVNWVKGGATMNLPDAMESVVQADNVVLYEKLEGSINGWKKVAALSEAPKQKLGYTVVNDTVTWECPYIYLYGGKDLSGKLNKNIRRGVINRLRLIPQV